MTEDAQQFIRSLYGSRNVNPQFQQIEQFTATGQTQLLVEIADEVGRIPASKSILPWVPTSIFDAIVRNLSATPGLANADAIMSIAHLMPPYDPSGTRHEKREQSQYAALLAGNHDVDSLMQVFAKYHDDPQVQELLTHLAQEMVLRGDTAENTPLARFWEQKIVPSEHPLSGLPLLLFPCEQGFVSLLPRYVNRGSSCYLPFGPFGDLGPRPDVSDDLPSWQAVEITPPDTSLIASAVRTWCEESNGKVEARIFELSHRATPESVNRHALMTLGLQCLEGADVGQVRINTDYLKDGLGALFSAAVNGGAYGGGVYGAYGRKETWRSVSGLLGCSDNTLVADLEATARQCTWYCFSADTPWFYQVAWDFGIAVLSHDGRMLALLAATDED